VALGLLFLFRHELSNGLPQYLEGKGGAEERTR